jgi:hypothetical protein
LSYYHSIFCIYVKTNSINSSNQKNKKMKLILYVYICLLISNTLLGQTNAHKLLWVKSVASEQANTMNVIDATYNGTDKDGNYYGVFRCNAGGVIDTSIAPFGAIGVAKWSCGSDTAQWVKWWYNSSPGINCNTYLFNAIVDKDGNSYILGHNSYGTTAGAHVFDTLFNYVDSYNFNDSVQSVILVKVDKNGNRVWIKYPFKFHHPGGGLSPGCIRSVIDNNGNIDYVYDNLYESFDSAHYKIITSYENFSLVPKGKHVVKVNPVSGNAISAVRLSMDVAGSIQSGGGFGFNNPNDVDIDFKSANSKFYLSCLVTDTVKVGNFMIYDTMWLQGNGGQTNILACFNNTGQADWVHKSVSGDINYQTFRPFLANNFALTPTRIYGNIYANNDTITQSSLTFEGFPFKSKYNNTSISGGIAVFDANTGVCINAIRQNTQYGIVRKLEATNNSLYVSGNCMGNSYFSSAINAAVDTLTPTGDYNNSSTALFLAKFDLDSNTTYRWSSGALGFNDIPQSINEDIYGNVYVAGYSAGSLQDSNGNYVNISSNQFIIKIGDPKNQCVCIVPTSLPSFVSNTGLDVTVKATSIGAVDSLVWFWGDGTQSIYTTQGANASHTYTTGGNKTICLRSYIACGFSDSCIAIKALATAQVALANIRVYPNPSNGMYTIENPFEKTVQFTIQNQQGQLIQQGFCKKGKQQINIANQATGIYYLQFVAQDGVKVVQKLVKE